MLTSSCVCDQPRVERSMISYLPDRGREVAFTIDRCDDNAHIHDSCEGNTSHTGIYVRYIHIIHPFDRFSRFDYSNTPQPCRYCIDRRRQKRSALEPRYLVSRTFRRRHATMGVTTKLLRHERVSDTAFFKAPNQTANFQQYRPWHNISCVVIFDPYYCFA